MDDPLKDLSQNDCLARSEDQQVLRRAKINVMASVFHLQTIEDFHTQYDGLKPYYEFWNGKAIQKAVPTRLHNLLQFLLTILLKEAGYKVGFEQELRIVEHWRPIPDVLAGTQIPHPFPTQPVDVVAEVLSPDDRMNQVQEKCSMYADLGIKQILVFDPQHRFGMVWNQESRRLVLVESVTLPNGKMLEFLELWNRLDTELL